MHFSDCRSLLESGIEICQAAFPDFWLRNVSHMVSGRENKDTKRLLVVGDEVSSPWGVPSAPIFYF